MKDLLIFLSSLRWQDYVDIFLNSYILFRLYVLFRGSRLIRVVPVVAMLWILNFLALSMGLVITTWAIQGVMAAAAIIFIIVFRDDIALVFNSRNPLSFFWGIPSRKLSTPIEIIAETMFELGRKKIGALLVFPGKQNIDDHIQGGVRWGGIISEQMLVSIFWDKNPVHDGAVIVKENKISQVSVILPLSKQNLPSRYGTRHRAAVGMSEVSDAMVIVVSEERGRVSIAKNSEIKEVKSVDALGEILAGHTGNVKKKGLENWKEILEFGIAGLLCFVLITGVWFGFSRGKETLKSINAPIEYTDIKQGYDIISVSTNTVDLQLSGSTPLLRALRPETVKVLLKLGNTTVGPNIFNISKDNIMLPPGVTLKKVEPQSVELVMGGLVQRKIPLQIDWSGTLDNTLILESAVPEPAFVEVTGVSPGVEDIVTLYTEKIPLESLKETDGGIIQAGIVIHPPSLKIADKFKTVAIKYVVKQRSSNEIAP
ncbi:MAG: DNA integrity scanning protein DisA nucleotide-binding domain protein [Desulfamplus sp.]|nr:DNA integrity scanning protein DisA nucleotide-binding domain protein [Desulfamplus sp.]